jgi:phosphoglycolate phosphatase-like HAD superfamily hydrolase
MNALVSLMRILACVVLLGCTSLIAAAPTGGDPLPSWNEGPAKQAILEFIRVTTDTASADFVAAKDRVATFDQDGTLWVEYPVYTQVRYCFNRLIKMASEKPALRDTEPFKTVLSGDQEAIAKLPMVDLMKIASVTLTGMSTDQYREEVVQWIVTAKDPRWKRLFTELIYQPMLEVLQYFRANGYRTYIATGGGQDFVRVFSDTTYGIPIEQVIGTAGGTKFTRDSQGAPILTKEPKVLLNDNFAGKPEGIHFMIGRQPNAAFGNSIGDDQMLEYTKAGTGKRLCMLLLHDDGVREYAYGPAQGLPDSKVGTFSQSLFDKAKKEGWIVISMKNDWKKVFPFDK